MPALDRPIPPRKGTRVIDQLCTHAFVDEGGYVTYGVDGTRKTQLQGKLLSAMMRFKL